MRSIGKYRRDGLVKRLGNHGSVLGEKGALAVLAAHGEVGQGCWQNVEVVPFVFHRVRPGVQHIVLGDQPPTVFLSLFEADRNRGVPGHAFDGIVFEHFDCLAVTFSRTAMGYVEYAPFVSQPALDAGGMCVVQNHVSYRRGIGFLEHPSPGVVIPNGVITISSDCDHKSVRFPSWHAIHFLRRRIPLAIQEQTKK